MQLAHPSCPYFLAFSISSVQGMTRYTISSTLTSIEAKHLLDCTHERRNEQISCIAPSCHHDQRLLTAVSAIGQCVSHKLTFSQHPEVLWMQWRVFRACAHLHRSHHTKEQKLHSSLPQHSPPSDYKVMH